MPNNIFSNHRKTKEGDVGDGILDVFDRYNFTVKEDEPLEKEVAVDPEMLGKVFENLLEVKDRKSKGTYYTPREIVHYMCQESLVSYLTTELNNKVSREDIDTFIQYGEAVVEHDSLVAHEGRETKTYSFRFPPNVRKNAKTIDQKLASIRVCDPAVGSGAFPVGMMNEIIRARNALTAYIDNKKERSPYDFKRHAIKNCLYGVDIDPGAVEIAKLRLWLSLIVDEEDRETIQPLPNLDYKIMQGNSLMDIQKEKMGVRNMFYEHSMGELKNAKQLYFNETSIGKKQQYKKQIDKIISQITNGHKEFDFEVYFSEVFQEKKGFDVVIANPPYVKEDVNRHAFDGLRDSDCYQGKMDLWYLFGSRGIDILRPNGVMCFIATNNWISNDGASKFRDKVITHGRIIDYMDFGDHKVFTAGIQTMVFVLLKSTDPKEYSLNYGRIMNNQTSVGVLEDFLQREGEMNNNDYSKFTVSFNRSAFFGKYINFVPPPIGKILTKMQDTANFYLNKNEIFSGIDVMQDFVTKKHLEKLKGSHSVGDGIFVLSDSEKQSRRWNKKELQLLKPYYTTKEIQRYYTNPHNRYWILYTSSQTNAKIGEYPNIKKHLDQFQSVITSVNKPYGLHRTRDESIFLGKKILATRKCARPTFSYVAFPSYVSRTFLVLKSDRIDYKYLLAILNSTLISFWLFHKGKLQGNQYQVDIVPLTEIPIVIPPKSAQEKIRNLVTNILAVTDGKAYSEDTAKQVKVQKYEKQVDQLVYQIYKLTNKEVEMVEGEVKK